MGEGYVLEWLDTLISVTLNPDKTNVELLHPQEIAFLRNHIDDEKNKVMLALKKMVFKMDDKAKIKSAVKLYYSSLIVLLDQALKNQIQISKYPQLKQTSNILIACINEILLLYRRPVRKLFRSKRKTSKDLLCFCQKRTYDKDYYD